MKKESFFVPLTTPCASEKGNKRILSEFDLKEEEEEGLGRCKWKRRELIRGNRAEYESAKRREEYEGKEAKSVEREKACNGHMILWRFY